MNKTMLAMGLAAVMAVGVAFAQPAGPGYGPGYGPGAGCGAAAADYGPGCGGYGAGHGWGRGMGWGGGPNALLTPEERLAFRDRMHAATTFDECNAAVAEHRQLLDARAKDRGVTPPRGPNPSMCERMKARGLLD